MRFRHLLRDVIFLTLPVSVLLVYLIAATTYTFYNSEIRNFHGYLAHGLRIGGPKVALRHAVLPLVRGEEERIYVLDGADVATDLGARVLDLWLPGGSRDALDRDLIASGREWQPARLVNRGAEVKVKVRYRGQELTSFFWSQKSWKIKLPKDHLVDGYRTLNLTPLQSRLETHLGFLAAERAGFHAPRSQIVRLFINRRDQGLYLQEEQVDESLVRRLDLMPGDVFYGELFPPDEPKSSSDFVFSNPFVWEKNDRNNHWPDEHRPYLVDLLDQVCDASPESLDRLYRLFDLDRLAEFYGLLAFLSDQHLDHHHNHKLYFNPSAGKFEPIVWDPLFQSWRSDGVESIANRLYRKLAQDPRFLDRVHRVLHDRLDQRNVTAAMLAELNRIEQRFGGLPINHRRALLERIRSLRKVVATRGETIRRLEDVAQARYAVSPVAGGKAIALLARSLASLRLTGIVLAEPVDARLFEDRDGDGKPGPPDRELKLRRDGRTLRVEAPDALVYSGRDFSASYQLSPGEEPNALRAAVRANRWYTRLAYLESRYLLLGASGEPEVAGLTLERTVGPGPVEVRAGAPDGFVASETIHPWSLPAAPPPREHRFAGTVDLRQDLVVGERDSFLVEPRTRFRLGRGVSVVLRSRVHLVDVGFERLQPEEPWGVVAIQGPDASGSMIDRCRFSGGSDDTVDYIYYSGMVSVHYANQVTLRDTLVERNVTGDDSIHFAKCHDLLLDRVRVEHALGDAIDLDLSSGVVRDTVVVDPKNDGLDLMTSTVAIERLEVLGANDKGISIGENSNPLITGGRLSGCVTGIGIKDDSDPVIRGTTIEDCLVAVSGYHKNWRYPGGGRGRLEDCALSGNKVDVKLDPLSTLVLQNCATGGKFQLPATLRAGAFQNREPRPPQASRGTGAEGGGEDRSPGSTLVPIPEPADEDEGPDDTLAD